MFLMSGRGTYYSLHCGYNYWPSRTFYLFFVGYEPARNLIVKFDDTLKRRVHIILSSTFLSQIQRAHSSDHCRTIPSRLKICTRPFSFQLYECIPHIIVGHFHHESKSTPGLSPFTCTIHQSCPIFQSTQDIQLLALSIMADYDKYPGTSSSSGHDHNIPLLLGI